MENKNLENIKGKKVLIVGMGKSGIGRTGHARARRGGIDTGCQRA